MDLPGRRECGECGRRWSYFETGSVRCPDCGSPRSSATGDREAHTDDPDASFDLTAVRAGAGTASTAELAGRAAETAAEYTRQRGFLRGGELAPLDGVFVAAWLVRVVGRTVARDGVADEETELFVLELLESADHGEWPGADEVPATLGAAYGTAAERATAAYYRDARRRLRDVEASHAATVADRLRTHRKRIAALEGDVHPRDAERLLRGTRDLGNYLGTDDESALVRAENWLDGLQGLDGNEGID